jgi:hypothetical protein
MGTRRIFHSSNTVTAQSAATTVLHRPTIYEMSSTGNSADEVYLRDNVAFAARACQDVVTTSLQMDNEDITSQEQQKREIVKGRVR